MLKKKSSWQKIFSFLFEMQISRAKIYFHCNLAANLKFQYIFSRNSLTEHNFTWFRWSKKIIIPLFRNCRENLLLFLWASILFISRLLLSTGKTPENDFKKNLFVWFHPHRMLISMSTPDPRTDHFIVPFNIFRFSI